MSDYGPLEDLRLVVNERRQANNWSINRVALEAGVQAGHIKVLLEGGEPRAEATLRILAWATNGVAFQRHCQHDYAHLRDDKNRGVNAIVSMFYCRHCLDIRGRET